MTRGLSTPWTVSQLAVAGGGGALGALLIMWAAVGSGAEDQLADQVGWLNCAVVGLVVSGVGGGSVLLSGRRAVGARRRRLIPDLVLVDRGAAIATPTGAWCWIEGTARAHRPGCELTRGKPTVDVDHELIRTYGLIRCEVCGG